MKSFLLISFLGSSLLAFPQSEDTNKDLSLWTWIQAEKKLGRGQYAEFQYQARFNENISQFSRSNFYFIYGINIQHLQIETLYQLNTNYKKDQHTFYLGLTYKQKISPRFTVFYRTAIQNNRNQFTGENRADKPYSEWRNRLRILYRINNLFSVTLSGEPYIKITPTQSAYLSRVRYVSQFNYKFNKYQTWSVFYLIEPEIPYYSQNTVDYVIGLTYHFRIPGKLKGFRKFFIPKSMESGSEEDTIPKDSFN